jgi:hypothetical protein
MLIGNVGRPARIVTVLGSCLSVKTGRIRIRATAVADGGTKRYRSLRSDLSAGPHQGMGKERQQ